VSVVANVAINVDSSGAVSKLRQVQQGAQATSQAVDKLNATNNALAASFTKSGKPIQTAANGMRFFTDATGRARKVNGQFVTTAEAAAAGLQKQGRAAQQAGASVSNFGGTVRALLGSFALIRSARFVFAKTAELESQSRSLAILAGSAEKAGKIIKELQELGAVTPFTSTELIDSAKRLQAFGVETEKVVETTRRLADASGATGAELSGLVTAYGQVQAKGRLQGEELLQFQERGIALQEELRKMYGMTGEEFQKALSKGQVSAKAVEVALANLTSTGGKYANGAIAQSDTLNGRLSTLQDGVDALARRIGQVLTPALKAIFNQAIAVVDAINAALAAGRGGGFTRNVAGAKQFLNIGATSQAVDNIAKGVGQVSSQKNKSGIQQNLQALQQYQRLLQSIGADDPNADRAVQLQGEILTKINQNLAAQKQLQSGAKSADKLFTPPLLDATSGGKKKGKTDAERAAEKKRRAAEELANLQGQVTLKEKLFGIDKQIAVEKERGSLVTAAALEMDKALEERQTRIAEITRSTADTATKNAQIKDATLDADQKIYAVQQAIKEQEAERTKSFDAIIADLNLELALKTATTEQERERLRIEAARAKLQADLKGQGFEQPEIDQITGLQAQVAAPLTDVQKIDQHIGKLKDEIADLTSISNIAITSAEGIGNAFAQSFQGLISGTMTAKEALGSFFKSVADMFLEMAAQIIAKQITMIILQTILKALGGAPGGGGGGGANLSNVQATDFAFNPSGMNGSLTPGGLFAKGGAFSNSIVSSPTLFKFADGGTTRTGLMGEAGPEAIMPLKRGPDGSLGVQANGLREAMGRPPGGTNGSPVLNMSFQSTSINGVEYVSREQLESAMAETRRNATRDGAKRGMTMTLDRIQNSSSTRRKVGI
jgi:lambda family phage tail tape measure protein